MDEEHLSAALELALERLLDDAAAEAADDRFDGQPIERRGLDHRHVPHARERHVERPGNRGRREREHVHGRSQLLHPLLVGDAEPVLLVDDHEAQILERDVLRQEPVRTDHDVHGALSQPIDHRFLLPGGAEARQQLDFGRERREPIGERGPVLLSQHGRRHQHRDLHAVADRLEGGAERDLGLAVPDVAGDEAIHRAAGLHVTLGVLDCLELVRRLLEPEGRLELTLPRRIRGERVAIGHRALRVEAQQSLGHLAQGGAHRLLHALPGRAAEPVEPRGAGVAAEVFRDQLETLDRQVEPIALGVLEQEKVALAITHLHRLQTQIAAEPVVFVDDDVAGRQVGERRERGAALILGSP